MVLIDELKVKFPRQTFSFYGECLVVPGAEFDPDWEDSLAEQGYKCILTDVDGKPVTLVRVDRKAGEGEKIVYSPKPEVAVAKPTAPALHLKRKMWTEEEDSELIKLWNLKPKLKTWEIASKFPPRSVAAVQCELTRLQRNGKIKPRWTKKKQKIPEVKAPPKTPIVPTGPEAEPAKDSLTKEPIRPSQFNVAINIQVSVDCSNSQAMESVLKFLKELS